MTAQTILDQHGSWNATGLCAKFETKMGVSVKKLQWIAWAHVTLLGLTACGPAREEAESTKLKALAIDPELKDRISLQLCTDQTSCERNEILFVHNPDGKAFERGYRADGFLSFQDGKILWNSPGSAVEIGRFEGGSVTALCSQDFEKVCDLELSIKHPNDPSDPQEPFYFVTFRLRHQAEENRIGESSSYHKNLLDYVIQAPNQENAGTCNLMAATGAMEILFNQWKRVNGYQMDTTINGTSDLSEPYTINIAAAYGYSTTLTPILAYNSNANAAVLSKDFPFLNSFNGGYDAKNNWGRQTPKTSKVAVPRVQAQVLFGGTTLNDNSKWDVALMNESQIESVKAELRKNRPVLVTYNHNDYWHVVVVVGYDDELSENCQMVRKYYDNPKATYGYKLRAAFDRSGCRDKGVFYVRDSLGPQARTPKYSVRSYDWLKYLGNHIISVRQE
jgi:hypothetical protein